MTYPCYNRGMDIIEYIRTVLKYDPLTGDFIRTIATAPRAKVGVPLKTKTPKGYLIIRVKGKWWLQHRLAFLYMTGEDIPEGMQVDHINRIKDDNRWENLRLLSGSANKHNSDPSKVYGISLDRKKYWRAEITVRRKVINLGSHSNQWDAICARKSGELTHLTQS
jgi:hypothetical protein